MGRFGTDGIRGRWPEPPLTPETARRLGAALRARFGEVLVLRDTRESGPALLDALARGLGDAAVDAGVLPTAALSAILASGGAGEGRRSAGAVGGLTKSAAGIAITASHNPWHDNGLKVLGPGGRKLSFELEAAIDADLDRDWPDAPGAPRALPDAEARYVQAVLASVRVDGAPADLSGKTIVVDAAHGAAWRTGPEILRRAGARVIATGCAPDGRNINRGVGALHPEATARAVVAAGADYGIALDGDADRCLLIGPDGAVLHGDALLLLIASAPGLAGTVMCNGALARALAARDIGFFGAAVGDRNVAIAMAERGWPSGGEPSGHVIFADGLPTGDGIQTALRAFARGPDAFAAAAAWRPDPQVNLSARVPRKPPLADLPQAGAALEAAYAGGAGRIVMRYSGTEPKLRVMVEAAEQPLAESLAQALVDRVCAAIDSASR